MQRRSAARRANLRALRLGKVSLERLHKRNGVSGSDFTITMPKLR